uniref:PDZ and pleckstrin homology domains 1 n=1 Tax=Anabas testudineus TaxID=64144 RepID=A0AAQ6IJ62_ANATE
MWTQKEAVQRAQTKLPSLHPVLPKFPQILETRQRTSSEKRPINRFSGSDHWARRRKLFKETKQWSSAGGSSVTSDITEESVSEDTRSLDMTIRDNEDKGFYTETFHSSAWIYQGNDVGSGAIPPSLNTRSRVVSIRERTVKISKGTGEYPWGFRIQFSKPIVVTEVDTNGAAEEAGLMVGDYVLAVNGTDVTSIPHSEAATLARQGPDVLTLTIGSDIARCPNTPWPSCRGYLHKRTQSGLIKGWRKRWFVLTHDCCLYYYRHKRDEGKRRALSAVKLEGAEVGQDTSLGKPFVFKCRPQSGSRVYFFCATSNQEMKRWLEAMEKAIHPITQNHVWVDVTRHNSNLPPLAVKNPECLGLLHKMDKNKDMWIQHYCILKDGCLYLYSGIRATHAHGGIYLQGYIVREQPFGSKKSTIELKPPCDEFKTFYLCAENPNENKRWIVAMKASIKKWLPLHQALQDYMNRPHEETRM